MANNRSCQVLLVVICLFLQGCSNIKVGKYNPDLKPPEGIVYFLPASEFDITLKWELKACPNDAANPDFEVKLTADVATAIVRDTSHTYVVSYDDLSKMSKTGKLELELSENGTLQSINVAAEDHSGEIIQNTISGASKIIRVAAGIPKIGPEAESVGEPLCREKVKKALVAVKALKGNIAEKRNAIDQANKEIAEWKKKKDSEEKKKALAKLDKSIKKAVGEIAALQTKGRSDYALISYTKAIRLVPGADGNIEDPVPLPRAILDNWFKPEKVEVQHSSELDAYAMLIRPETRGADSDRLFQGNNDKAADLKAFIYRQPVSAALMICKGRHCLVNGDYIPHAKRVYSANVPVPQYGYIATLPYENKMFGKNSMQVNFYSNGGIKKFTHEEEKSAGAGAAQAFADTAGQVYEFESERQSAKTVKKQAKASAKTGQLNQQKEELTAEKEVLQLELEVKKARDELDLYTGGD